MDAAIATEGGPTRPWQAYALLGIGALASALVVAAVWNPWRLLVFDDHLARWAWSRCWVSSASSRALG